MVKLILGNKGTGKTKQIIDLVNSAVANDNGKVVCIAKGDKLRFDISHSARLVDISGYIVSGYSGLFGFISGLHAGNFDITQVFIDSLYKVVDDDSIENAENFLQVLDGFSKAHGVEFTVAISADQENVSSKMRSYL